MEILLRWRRQNGSTELPDVFIPIIEDLGLMTELVNWVLSDAIAQFQTWDQKLPQFSEVSLNINISVHKTNKAISLRIY